MYLRLAFLLITRMTTWVRLSRREEAWQTAEIVILITGSPSCTGGSRAGRT